jgi:hypothetical protein
MTYSRIRRFVSAFWRPRQHGNRTDGSGTHGWPWKPQLLPVDIELVHVLKKYALSRKYRSRGWRNGCSHVSPSALGRSYPQVFRKEFAYTTVSTDHEGTIRSMISCGLFVAQLSCSCVIPRCRRRRSFSVQQIVSVLKPVEVGVL